MNRQTIPAGETSPGSATEASCLRCLDLRTRQRTPHCRYPLPALCPHCAELVASLLAEAIAPEEAA